MRFSTNPVEYTGKKVDNVKKKKTVDNPRLISRKAVEKKPLEKQEKPGISTFRDPYDSCY